MGRGIHANDHISSLDPIISYSLLVACGAATMAIISALCGGRFKKKQPTSPSSSTSPRGAPEKPANSQLSRESTSMTIEENGNAQEDNDDQLPLPPGMRKPEDGPALNRTYSCKNYMTKSASARDAMCSSSESGRVSRTMSAVRDLDRKKKSKVKSQDSVWMKSIILGEKCKVPDDEIGNNIVYDVGKGKKIQTYYPRTQKSLQLSRSNSSLGSGIAEAQN